MYILFIETDHIYCDMDRFLLISEMEPILLIYNRVINNYYNDIDFCNDTPVDNSRKLRENLYQLTKKKIYQFIVHKS